MNINRNIVNAVVLAAVACMGSGCMKQGAGSAVAEVASDRVLTVDEYLKQPDLRKKVFAACANDPGRKGDDPNCVNATRAERIASAGSGNFPNVTP
jgi:hypothetical protein